MRNIAKRIISKAQLILSSNQRRHSMVGPAQLWKMKRDFQIQFLKKVGLKQEHYLLDIGCGTLRGGIPIIQYLKKGRYFGIESRSDVFKEGQKEIHYYHLEDKAPTLIEAEDISCVNLSEEFDYIWAFSVLIHMTDEILNDCFCFVKKHLKKEGSFYANVNIGDESDKSWQGFPVVYRSLEFYIEACSRHDLNLIDMGPLKDYGHISGIKSQDEQRMLMFLKD